MRFPEDMVLSVVAPAYNEAGGIAQFVTEVYRVLGEMGVRHEVILVDDGSRDGTLLVMRELEQTYPTLRVFALSRNFGHEIAMTAGLDQAKGDYVVILDSDMQDPPRLIPALLEKALTEQLEMVYAARSSRPGETLMKTVTSRWFYRLASTLTGLPIPENAGDFRIMSRRVVHALNQMREHNRCLKMFYAHVGFKTGHVMFERPPRAVGASSYNWVRLLNAAMDAIFAFSSKPLRWMSLLSLGISGLLMVYAGSVLLKKLVGGHAVEGWTSLMFMMTLMFGIMFLFMAVLSEYIGRILTEAKQRPLYYLQDERGSAQVIPLRQEQKKRA